MYIDVNIASTRNNRRGFFDDLDNEFFSSPNQTNIQSPIKNNDNQLRDWNWTDPLREGGAGLVSNFAPSNMETERLQSLIGLNDEQFIDAVRAGRVTREEWPLGKMPQAQRDAILAGQISKRQSWAQSVNDAASYITPTPHRVPESGFNLENIGYEFLRNIPGVAEGIAELAAASAIPFGAAFVIFKNILTGNQAAQEQVYSNLRNQGYDADAARRKAMNIWGNLANLGIQGGTTAATMHFLGQAQPQNLIVGGASSPIAQAAGNIGKAALSSGAGAFGQSALTDIRSENDVNWGEAAKQGAIGAGVTGAIGLGYAAFQGRKLWELQKKHYADRSPIDATDWFNGLNRGDDAGTTGNNPHDDLSPSGNGNAINEPSKEEINARLQQYNDAMNKHGLPTVEAGKDAMGTSNNVEKSVNNIIGLVVRGEMSPEEAVATLVDAGFGEESSRNIIGSGVRNWEFIQQSNTTEPQPQSETTEQTSREPQEVVVESNWEDPLYSKKSSNTQTSTQQQTKTLTVTDPKTNNPVTVQVIEFKNGEINFVVEGVPQYDGGNLGGFLPIINTFFPNKDSRFNYLLPAVEKAYRDYLDAPYPVELETQPQETEQVGIPQDDILVVTDPYTNSPVNVRIVRSPDMGETRFVVEGDDSFGGVIGGVWHYSNSFFPNENSRYAHLFPLVQQAYIERFGEYEPIEYPEDELPGDEQNVSLLPFEKLEPDAPIVPDINTASENSQSVSSISEAQLLDPNASLNDVLAVVKKNSVFNEHEQEPQGQANGSVSSARGNLTPFSALEQENMYPASGHDPIEGEPDTDILNGNTPNDDSDFWPYDDDEQSNDNLTQHSPTVDNTDGQDNSSRPFYENILSELSRYIEDVRNDPDIKNILPRSEIEIDSLISEHNAFKKFYLQLKRANELGSLSDDDVEQAVDSYIFEQMPEHQKLDIYIACTLGDDEMMKKVIPFLEYEKKNGFISPEGRINLDFFKNMLTYRQAIYSFYWNDNPESVNFTGEDDDLPNRFIVESQNNYEDNRRVKFSMLPSEVIISISPKGNFWVASDNHDFSYLNSSVTDFLDSLAAEAIASGKRTYDPSETIDAILTEEKMKLRDIENGNDILGIDNEHNAQALLQERFIRFLNDNRSMKIEVSPEGPNDGGSPDETPDSPLPLVPLRDLYNLDKPDTETAYPELQKPNAESVSPSIDRPDTQTFTPAQNVGASSNVPSIQRPATQRYTPGKNSRVASRSLQLLPPTVNVEHLDVNDPMWQPPEYNPEPESVPYTEGDSEDDGFIGQIEVEHWGTKYTLDVFADEFADKQKIRTFGKYFLELTDYNGESVAVYLPESDTFNLQGNFARTGWAREIEEVFRGRLQELLNKAGFKPYEQEPEPEPEPTPQPEPITEPSDNNNEPDTVSIRGLKLKSDPETIPHTNGNSDKNGFIGKIEIEHSGTKYTLDVFAKEFTETWQIEVFGKYLLELTEHNGDSVAVYLPEDDSFHIQYKFNGKEWTWGIEKVFRKRLQELLDKAGFKPDELEPEMPKSSGTYDLTFTVRPPKSINQYRVSPNDNKDALVVDHIVNLGGLQHLVRIGEFRDGKLSTPNGKLSKDMLFIEREIKERLVSSEPESTYEPESSSFIPADDSDERVDDEGFVGELKVPHGGKVYSLDIFYDEMFDRNSSFLALHDYSGQEVAVFFPPTDKLTINANFQDQDWTAGIEKALRENLPEIFDKAGVSVQPKEPETTHDSSNDKPNAPKTSLIPKEAKLLNGTLSVHHDGRAYSFDVKAWVKNGRRRLYINEPSASGKNKTQRAGYSIGYYDAKKGTFEDFEYINRALNQAIQDAFIEHIRDFYDDGNNPSPAPDKKPEGLTLSDNQNNQKQGGKKRTKLSDEQKKALLEDYLYSYDVYKSLMEEYGLTPLSKDEYEAAQKKHNPTPEKNDNAVDTAPHSKVADRVKAHVLNGREPLSNKQLFAWADEAFGGTMADGKYTVKDAYDAMELGLNLAIQELGINPASAENINDAIDDLDALMDILQLLPTQRNRTQEQIDFQQFSTPPTLAYLVNWLANISEGDYVLEPSAGLGSLAVFARNAGADVVLNELEPRRAALLQALGLGKLYRENAEHIGNILAAKKIAVDRVVMNPPFSATAGRVSAHSSKNGIRHLEQALMLLKPGGRLVAILGKGMGINSRAHSDFWKHIKKKFNIRASISIDGNNYSKFGTSWDNVIVVIDNDAPTPENGTFIASFSDLHDMLKDRNLQNIQWDVSGSSDEPDEPDEPDDDIPTDNPRELYLDWESDIVEHSIFNAKEVEEAYELPYGESISTNFEGEVDTRPVNIAPFDEIKKPLIVKNRDGLRQRLSGYKPYTEARNNAEEARREQVATEKKYIEGSDEVTKEQAEAAEKAFDEATAKSKGIITQWLKDNGYDALIIEDDSEYYDEDEVENGIVRVTIALDTSKAGTKPKTTSVSVEPEPAPTPDSEKTEPKPTPAPVKDKPEPVPEPATTETTDEKSDDKLIGTLTFSYSSKGEKKQLALSIHEIPTPKRDGDSTFSMIRDIYGHTTWEARDEDGKSLMYYLPDTDIIQVNKYHQAFAGKGGFNPRLYTKLEKQFRAILNPLLKAHGYLNKNGQIVTDGKEAFRVLAYKHLIIDKKEPEDFVMPDNPFSNEDTPDNPLTWRGSQDIRDRALHLYFRQIYYGVSLNSPLTDTKYLKELIASIKQELRKLFEQRHGGQTEAKPEPKPQPKPAPTNENSEQRDEERISEPKPESTPEPKPATPKKTTHVPTEKSDKPTKTANRWNALARLRTRDELQTFLPRLSKDQLLEIADTERFDASKISIYKAEKKNAIVDKLVDEIMRRYELIDAGQEVTGTINGEEIILDTPLIRARKAFRDNGETEPERPKRGRPKKPDTEQTDNDPNSHVVSDTKAGSVSAVKIEAKSDEEMRKEQEDLDSNIRVQENKTGDSEVQELSIHSTYRPSIKIEGAKNHPADLVESAAMASVKLPPPTYRPNLPEAVINEGRLSIAQLEAVVYAGRAFQRMNGDGTRRGFFIGDGTGVGKGREISGIIMDQLRQGHGKGKAVWISDKHSLISDAKRDWSGLGNNPNDIFAHDKISDSKLTAHKDGIIFSAYSYIKSKDRVQQLKNWLGEDFDGVIVLDECHNANNAITSGKGLHKKSASATALRTLEFVAAFPNARVLYVSATGATEVRNLAMLDRLGLWGGHSQFANKTDFINSISKGQTAAMELVSRDMKAMGLYIARSLSMRAGPLGGPEDVTFRALVHNLNSQQIAIYNEYSRAWKEIFRKIDEAYDILGGNGKKGLQSAKNQFWGYEQRFFNQVLITLQTPAAIEDMRKQLEAGNSVVVQFTNTFEAGQDKAVQNLKERNAKIKDSPDADDEMLTFDDLDISPTEIMLKFLQELFPIYEVEEVEDENGNTTIQEVVDSEGHKVINQEAVKIRDKLIEHVSSIKLISESPIDMILDAFGYENVSEITGRSERYVIDEATGRRVLQKRNERQVQAEIQDFNDGRRHILLFSEKGGTGASYHASNSFKNKQKRIHYLLQPGWRADKALQGLGRTHRSNEAHKPEYVLVSTDVPGQKRFLSTIARRLEQLGALTSGERKAAANGLFSEDDNLEANYVKEAMITFFRNLDRGEYPELSPEQVFYELGFDPAKILIATVFTGGGFKGPKITVTQFLNRLLVMEVGTQKKLFARFEELINQYKEVALAENKLDVRTENFPVLSFKVISEDEIKEDSDFGTKTKYVQIEITKSSRPRTWDDSIIQKAKAFYLDDSGRILAAVPRKLSMIEINAGVKDGEMFTLHSIQRERPVGEASINILNNMNPRQLRHFTKLSTEEAHRIWDEKVAAYPGTTQSVVHMITGTLLPIWKSLDTSTPRVRRLIDKNGNTILGRFIPEGELQKTISALGLGRVKKTNDKINAKALREKLNQQGTVAVLQSNIELRYVRVNGYKRIEVLNADFFMTEKFTANGDIIKEIINGKPRFFIKENNDAAINRILFEFPVIRFYNRDTQASESSNDPRNLYAVHPFFRPDPDDNPLINSSPYAFDDEETEKRYQGSKKIKPESVFRKLLDFGEALVKGFRSDLPELAGRDELVYAQELLRKFKRERRADVHETVSRLRDALKGLTPDDFDLFSRAMQLLDLRETKDLDTDAALPWGLDYSGLERAFDKVMSAVNDNYRVQNAIDKAEALGRELTEQLADAADALNLHQIRNRLKRQHYFRHVVLDYFNFGSGGSGATLKNPQRRGYLHHREGSDKDISSDWITAMGEVWTRMNSDIKVLHTLAKLRGKYDIAEDLKKKAIHENMKLALYQIMDTLKDSYNGDDLVRVAEGKLNSILSKKQASAIARLFKMAHNGDLPEGDNGEWTDIIDAMRHAGTLEGLPSDQRDAFTRYVGWLASLNDKSRPSAAAMRFIRSDLNKQNALKNVLGESYVTWQDLIPDGYELWSPIDSNLVFSANSVPENMIKLAQQNIDELLGMPLSELGSALNMGGDKQVWVIPAPLAKTLNDMGKSVPMGLLAKGVRWATGAFKSWVLFSPVNGRVLKYNWRNFFGDLEAVLQGNPGALRYVRQAFNELKSSVIDGNNPSATLTQFQKRGGALTAESRNELLNNWEELQDFANLLEQKKHVSPLKMGLNFFKGYMKLATKLTEFREAILRYAAFLSYLDMLKDNHNHPSFYGMSKPNEVNALDDVYDRAFKLANENLGAYDQISQNTQWLRDNSFLTFISWVEVNFKRSIQLYRNIWSGNSYLEHWIRKHGGDFINGFFGGGNGGNNKPPKGNSGNDYPDGEPPHEDGDNDNSDNAFKKFFKRLRRLIGRSPVYALRFAITLALSMPLMLILSIANWLNSENDEKLTPDIRSQPHLTLNTNYRTGEVLYLNRLGSAYDFFETIGLDNLTRNLRDFFDGRISFLEIANNITDGPISKLVNNFNPIAKAAIELLTGRKLYPDIEHPTSIRDNWEYVAQSLSLEWYYNFITGKPHAPFSDFSGSIASHTKQDEASYWFVLARKKEFQEKVLGRVFDGYTQTRQGEALYNARKAAQFGDFKKMREYLRQFYKLGGSEQGINASIRAMSPLYGLNDEEELRFMKWLPKEERKALRQSMKFYERLMALLSL